VVLAHAKSGTKAKQHFRPQEVDFKRKNAEK